MKFIRIDKQTVNCIISEDDMDEQGITPEDFLTKKKNVIHFLHDILEKASEEVGYKPTGHVTPMQVDVLSDGSISLTITENVDESFRKILENLTNKLGVKLPDRILRELGDVPEEERIDKLKEFILNLKDFTDMFKTMVDNHQQKIQEEGAAKADKKDPARELAVPVESLAEPTTEKKKKKRLRFDAFALSFDSAAELMRFVRRIPDDLPFESKLYREPEKGRSYELLICIGKASERAFASVFTIGYEYRRYVTISAATIALFEEHGICVIDKDAIQKLHQVKV